MSTKMENDSCQLADISSIPYNELSDIFYLSSKKGNVFHVRLTSNGLLLHRDSSAGVHKDHQVNICDIIGGRCVWIQKSVSLGTVSTCGACTTSVAEKQHENDAFLFVFAYILKKNLRNIRRERTVITLRFRSFDSYEDNMRDAEKWYKTLKSHINNHQMTCSIRGKGYDTKKKTFGSKRLLILLNPKSGSGKARELFNQQVVPILNEAELDYDLNITKHPHHACDFVRQKNLTIWCGIVAIGGDGLFHEILNGILKRHDWKHVVNNLSLGVVPCGSGNGLARSIAHCFQEPYEPKPILGAALTIVGGQSMPMDIVEIELNNKVTYSFLSIGWGLISDIDIESERLRPLGYQRFTIWTLHRLINLRTYRGRISFLQKNISSEIQNCAENILTKKEASLSNNISCNALNELKKHSNIETFEFEDVISLDTVVNQSFHSRCNSLHSAKSRVSTYYSIADSIYHSISGNSDYNETNKNDLESIADCRSTRLSQLDDNTSTSTLLDPLPSTWFVEEGEFVMIHAVYQSHLGSDCYFSPQSRLDDGTIYLVIIRGGISRSQLFNFLINMSSGTHLPQKNTDYIRVEPVVAFRLEPFENSGILTVDGERMECGSLQARIIPGTVNVMVPNKDSLKYY